jgi:hypothetical protein
MKELLNGIYRQDMGLIAGQIGMANEAALGNGFLSQPLTQFVTADTSAADLEALLEYLAGRVACGRRFEYRVAARGGKIATVSANDDIRAIGGSFKVVEARGQVEQGKTRSKGLTMAVDIDDDKENPTAREESAQYLRALLTVLEIRRVLALHEANVEADNKVWSEAVGGVWADPDADLMAACNVDGRNTNPNRALIGASALANRFRALRAGDTGKGATALFTLQQLAGLCGLADIRSEKIVYQDDAGANQNLIPANKIYGFYQPSGGTRYDASNIKRFVTGDWRVFVRELESVILVTVSHYSEIVLLDATGLVLMEVA